MLGGFARTYTEQQAVGREELGAAPAIKAIDFSLFENSLWTVMYGEGTCKHTKNRAAGKGRARENERTITLQPCGAEKPPSVQRRERRAPAPSAPRCSWTWTRAPTTVDRQECACALDITITRVRLLIHLCLLAPLVHPSILDTLAVL